MQRLARNTGWLLAAEVVATIVSVFQFPLVARLLGVERFGVLHLVMSTVGLITALLTVRVWETIIRFLTEFEAQDEAERALAIVKLAYGLDIVLGVLVFAFVAVIAPLLGALVVQTSDATDLIRLEGLRHLLLVTSGASTAILRVFDRFRWLSAFNAFSAIGIFALVASSLFLGWDVFGYILAFILIAAAQSIILYRIATRILRVRFGGNWWSADLTNLHDLRRPIAVMLFSINVDAIRKVATANADTVILGLFTGPYSVGIYRLAKQLAGYATRLSNPLYTALYPEIVRLYNEQGIERMRAFVGQLRRVLVIGVVALIGGALVLGRPIILGVFGYEYEPAIPVFNIIIFMNVWIVFIWAPGVLIATGKVRQLTMINTISSLLSIVLIIVFTFNFGLLGAASAIVIGTFLGSSMIAVYLIRLRNTEWRTSDSHINV